MTYNMNWYRLASFCFLLIAGVLASCGALEADGNIPVLVLARHADLDCYAEAVQLGAVDPMDKPLTPSEVAELVTKHVRLDSSALSHSVQS